MKGKSWTNQNFTNSPYDNEYLLSSFSQESIQIFHPEGQRKRQSSKLWVWIGWNCKERKIVWVFTWEQEQLLFCILMAAGNEQQFCSRLQGHISHYRGYAEGRVHNYRYHSPVGFSKSFSFLCLFFFFLALFLIAMEYAELQMLLLAVFFLIPGVIYSFPSCKNNLFIPFLRPAWDGSHFPHSLWFYHNCLPTYVLCLSYRVFLLQKAAKQFSPAAEKLWSVQKSLRVELIASLLSNFRERGAVP